MEGGHDFHDRLKRQNYEKKKKKLKQNIVYKNP
jgi:hypothetical protein